jgi:hypothetical protein
LATVEAAWVEVLSKKMKKISKLIDTNIIIALMLK